MKNINTAEATDIFLSVGRCNNAYQNKEFAVSVMCAAFGKKTEDFGKNGTLQIDHIIPQNPHLDPANHFDHEFIEALDLSPDDLQKINGKEVYVVSGYEIIDAVFDRFLPDLPYECRPSVHNIINLRPLTSVANNMKSNRLSGTMETLFETLCGHARGYVKHIADARCDMDLQDMARAFGSDESGIRETLQAIDRVDKALVDGACNKRDHLIVEGINLSNSFRNAALATKTNFQLPRYMAVFEDERLVQNGRMADRLSESGVRLSSGFNGTVVNLNGNFRESYDRFRSYYLSHANDRLKELQDERKIERHYRLAA